MNELLKASYSDDRVSFSARELHEFLEVKTKFQDWIPRMCEYGFQEGSDYTPVKIENVPSQKRERTYLMTDYQITIDMAKEIAMIQRNEKGKQARQYFLEIERRWNSPEYIMDRALQLFEKKNKALEQQNQELLPLARYAAAICKSDTLLMVGDLAALITQNGYSIGRLELFSWLRDKGYLMRQRSSWNLPTRKSMKLSLFRIFEEIYNSEGVDKVKLDIQVTEKGQQYFIKKFMKETNQRVEVLA